MYLFQFDSSFRIKTYQQADGDLPWSLYLIGIFCLDTAISVFQTEKMISNVYFVS